MRCAQRSLGRTNPLGRLFQTGEGDRAPCKVVIQIAFLSYQNSPKRNCFCLHRFKEGSQFTDLISSQMKLVSEFNRMNWAGIAVQLCGERKAHTPTGA